MKTSLEKDLRALAERVLKLKKPDTKLFPTFKNTYRGLIQAAECIVDERGQYPKCPARRLIITKPIEGIAVVIIGGDKTFNVECHSIPVKDDYTSLLFAHSPLATLTLAQAASAAAEMLQIKIPAPHTDFLIGASVDKGYIRILNKGDCPVLYFPTFNRMSEVFENMSRDRYESDTFGYMVRVTYFDGQMINIGEPLPVTRYFQNDFDRMVRLKYELKSLEDVVPGNVFSFSGNLMHCAIATRSKIVSVFPRYLRSDTFDLIQLNLKLENPTVAVLSNYEVPNVCTRV